MNWHIARRRAIRKRMKERGHLLLVFNRGIYFNLDCGEEGKYLVPLNGREQPGCYRKYV